MLIEIRKAGFKNKGAELMLLSILQELKTRIEKAEFAMAAPISNDNAPYIDRAKYCFYQKPHYWKKRIQFSFLAKFLSKNIRQSYGIVLDDEIDVVVDASGFSYSDQFGEASCLELLDASKKWKKNKTISVLLPQAFGPFKSKQNIRAMREAIENITIVFARDQISYDYLHELVGEKRNIFLSPDFTNLIKGKESDHINLGEKKVAIVPNSKMIEKTSIEDSQKYIPFLCRVIEVLDENGFEPFILIHEGEEDLNLAKEIKLKSKKELEILNEKNPLILKSILSKCYAQIGSRYHALISGLSQGIPSFAVGWSHKYEMLFQDYNFTEGIMSLDMNHDEVKKKLKPIIGTDESKLIKKSLLFESEKLKKKTNEMWEIVINEIQKAKQ